MYIKLWQRFFVPTNRGKGIPILTQLLGRYPIDKSDEEARGPEQESLSIEVSVSQAKVVDLEEWIQAPEEVARRSARPEPYESPATTPSSAAGDDSSDIITALAFSPDAANREGASLLQLLELRAELHSHRRLKPRPVIEAQGVLFAKGEDIEAAAETKASTSDRTL